MSQIYTVIGAGPVGRTIAEQLLARGEKVRVLTRSGSGPRGAERVAVDAGDPVALRGQLDGSATVFHCAHAAYDVRAWERELPRTEAAVLEEAGRAATGVVFPESLYSYSRTDKAMTETSERAVSTGKGGVRARLLLARAAHSTPTASVVASDFIGPYALASHVGERMLSAVLAERMLRVVGSPDQAHSFTYVPDLAATMIAVADRGLDGDRLWHAATGAPVTQREVARGYARLAGVREPRIGRLPTALLRVLGVGVPMMRELAEVAHQFERPFVLDSAVSQAELGLVSTPFDQVLAETVAWWRSRT
ncbi:NAD-dependent epimerase/dehydratase family protein [Nocardioides ochotonae]|uniref:NAD-dependent epimerase/dehydratase family protein n=1 Tax=Nocardioides ochotonae TaxID=2685869 RepID=UPI00140B0A37|nr:NAD-dependent epimerase/dehydratase family protein [Nocardioides ochotonae]